ncbi:MAG: hypothetical protein AAFV53_40645 [Myxococcota bacterium]
MRLRNRPLLLCSFGLFAASGIAMAAGWADFKDAFDPLPCSDGWAGCEQRGQRIDADMVKDGQGRPHPSTMRVSFFDLQPLPGFSPFVSLTEYSGEAVAVAEDPPDPDPIQNDPVRNDPVRNDPVRNDPVRNDPDPVRINNNPDRPPPDPVRNDPEPIRTDPDPVVDNTPPEPVRTDPDPVVDNTPPDPVRTDPDPVAINNNPDPVGMRPPEPVDDSCDDLVALEAPAMMGTLGAGKRKCLEGRLAGTATQTTKNKISRVLIADAEARGDRGDWERLMKRHLEDIDRSDPNLCFKYAIHLAKTGRNNGVIRWADYALENKQQWSGATYKKNVYALYQLKTKSSNKLWQSAEKKFVEDRSDQNEANAKRWRDTTKNYAREWLDYARATGQSTKSPLALCVSAAGSAEFCQQ